MWLVSRLRQVIGSFEQTFDWHKYSDVNTMCLLHIAISTNKAHLSPRATCSHVDLVHIERSPPLHTHTHTHTFLLNPCLCRLHLKIWHLKLIWNKTLIRVVSFFVRRREPSFRRCYWVVSTLLTYYLGIYCCNNLKAYLPEQFFLSNCRDRYVVCFGW